MAEAEGIKVNRTGYAFIVSKQGRYLAYPDKARIMQGMIQEANPELGRRMIAGEEGFLSTTEPVGGRDALVAFVPIQNCEFSLAIVYPRNEVTAAARRLQNELLAVGVVALAALLGALWIVAQSISRPITQLARAAQEVAQGNLEMRVNVAEKTDEVRDLAAAFNKMTRELQMRMEELRYTTRIQERIEGELTAARNIQKSLLRKTFPAFPDRVELDIHAVVKPARAVGGDFYDFYFLDRDRICLMIGDVAGKGVPAALFMAVSKTLLRTSLALDCDPAEIMAAVSDRLFEESGAGMFVSLACVLLNVHTGAMEVCNAGHPPPFVLSASGVVKPLEVNSGVALGAWRDLKYESTHRQLTAGDTLLFFTDGITEAFDPKRCLYSTDRLQKILAGCAGQTAERITNFVVQDVRGYCAGCEQSDDITLMAVRWHGPVIAVSDETAR